MDTPSQDPNVPLSPETGGKRLLTPSAGITGLSNVFVRYPPAAVLQEVRAKSSSSSANRYTWLSAAPLWDLLDEMMDRDACIAATVDLMGSMILESPRQIVLSDDQEDDAKAQAAREFLLGIIADVDFEAMLWPLLIGSIAHGFSVIEIMWEIAPDGMVTPARFYHCHPGQFNFDDNDNLLMLDSSMQGTQAPPTKFLVARTPGLYDCPWGKSALFPLRWLYYWKKRAITAMSRFADKYGFPLLHGELPTAQSTNTTLFADLKKALEDAVEGDCVITSNGEKITSIDRTSGASSEPHRNIVEYADGEIIRALLGSTLATKEASFGTRAQSEVHEDTTNKKLRPYADLLAKTITDQLFKPLVLWNFGPGVEVPRLVINTDKSNQGVVAGRILELCAKLGLPVSESEAREMLGVRAPKDGEPLLVPPVPITSTTPVPESILAKAHSGGSQDFYRATAGKAGAELWEGDTPAAWSFRAGRLAEARGVELQAHRRVDSSAMSIAQDELDPLLLAATKAFIARAKDHPQDQPVPPRLAHDFAVPLDDTVPLIKKGLWAAKISADLAIMEHAKVIENRTPHLFAVEDGFELFLEKAPESFRTAALWMMSKKTLTKSMLEALVREYSANSGVSLATAEREIRQKAFAIAGAANVQATEKVQALVARAVAKGETLSDFLAGVDDLMDSGVAVGGTDAYWENVMRTELTSAYSHEQARSEARISNHVWGHEGLNPQDDRSRQGHAHTAGILFKAGSQASGILGRPPYGYRCRCCLVPIIVPNPSRSGYEESSSALSVASSVERF